MSGKVIVRHTRCSMCSGRIYSETASADALEIGVCDACICDGIYGGGLYEYNNETGAWQHFAADWDGVEPPF